MKTHHALLLLATFACGSSPSTVIPEQDAGQDVVTLPDTSVPDLGTPSGDSSNNVDMWVAGDSGSDVEDGAVTDVGAPDAGTTDVQEATDTAVDVTVDAGADVVVDAGSDAGCQAAYETCLSACTGCERWCEWECKSTLEACLGEDGSSGCGH